MGLITKPKPPLDQHAVAHLRVLGFSTSSIAKRLKVPVSEIYDVYQDATYQQLEVRAEEELFQQLHGRQWRLAFQTLSAIERLLKSRDRAYVTAGVHHALEILQTFDPSQSRRRSLSVDEARISTAELMANLRRTQEEEHP